MFFNALKIVILSVILTVFLTFSIIAEDAPKEYKYSMGIRLGGWANQGGLPLESVVNEDDPVPQLPVCSPLDHQVNEAVSCDVLKPGLFNLIYIKGVIG